MSFYRMLISMMDAGNGRYITDFHHVRLESWMSTWLIPFFCAAIIGLCVFQYSREKSLDNRKRIVLITLRSLAYIMLLFVIAMPRLVIEGEGAPPGTVPVVVDGTDSMLIKDTEDNRTRISRAVGIYKGFGEANRHKDDLRMEGYFAGKEFRQIENADKLEPDADYTSINQMLEKGIAKHMGEYCPGVVLLGDGAHNTTEIPENTVRLFQKLNIPVYTCGIGKEKSKDISADYILGEEVVFL